jgi:hypothetical protein
VTPCHLSQLQYIPQRALLARHRLRHIYPGASVAKTVAASFVQLKSRLEISGLQQSTVSTRHTRVRAAVSRKLDVLESFVTGSYRRHTMIGPLKQADIDVFVVLDPKYHTTAGFGTILDRVRRVLLETYPSTPKISRNGQAVTITFTDFVVDVVPAFHRRGGGYLIPSTTAGRWISTDPKAHETFMSTANFIHKGNLVPTVKLVKAWNQQIGRPFRSFYLELLVEQVLRGVTISDAPSACRYVFDKGRSAIKLKIPDPSRIAAEQVEGLNGISVADAVKRFTTAHSRAAWAEDFARRGDSASGVDRWRLIFGDRFPAYG